MLLKGRYKLILPRSSKSPLHFDGLYDLESDPHEMRNLLKGGSTASSPRILGKVEHLKVLLMEWMLRNDRKEGFYTDPAFQLGEGAGDVKEIFLRRTWKKLEFWQSDFRLGFTRPVLQKGFYVQNEFLYIGRTRPGTLIVQSVSVTGPHAQYFTVSQTNATIAQDEFIKIKVSFRSISNLSFESIRASIEIQNSVNGIRKIPIESDSGTMVNAKTIFSKEKRSGETESNNTHEAALDEFI
jgi:hypothetical protein